MGSPLTYIALAFVLLASATNTVHAWTPGVGNASATSGFIVDRQSRNDVVSFWHHVYKASEGYESRINWTGTPGTTSSAFKGDVQRRVNFYRAMAGMNADMGMNTGSTVWITQETPTVAKPAASTTKGTAAQAAAYMVSKNSDEYDTGGWVANGGNPHDPTSYPSSWGEDTSEACNGAFYSNLVSNLFGPRAMDAYMHENDQGAGGAANVPVAHRRLILYSRRAEFATGDVTGLGSDLSANALYCSGNLLPVPEPEFVAWPSDGYFPEPLSTKFWSLSYPGADFSSATVTMNHMGGSAVTVSVQELFNGYADNTLVWVPTQAQMPSSDAADQSYNVIVSNILIGGVAQSYSYTVTVINPDRLEESGALIGSVSPPDSGARYFFEPVVNAEEYEFDVSFLSTATWLEGAEDGESNLIVDDTHEGYSLRAQVSWSGQDFWDAGSKAFRLAFPDNSFESQSFTINRTVIPQSGAALTLRLRRGYMTAGAKLEVQSSINGGDSWDVLETYSGNGNGSFDTKGFSNKVISIPSVGEHTLIRFVLSSLSGGYNLVDHAAFPVGVFIDGVAVSNCDSLESLAPTSYSSSADSVMLNASTAGGSLVVGYEYVLRVRARMGDHWFPYSESLSVTPVAASSLSSYQSWMRSEYFLIGGFDEDYDADGVPNGVERVFGMDPTDKSDASEALKPKMVNGELQLSHSIIDGESVEAEKSGSLQVGSWQPVTVTITGDVATVSVPLTGPSCYLRWKVSQ